MRNHRQNWLDIFSTFRVAFDFRKMLLGAFGVAVTLLVLLAIFALASQFWPSAIARADQCYRVPTEHVGPTVQLVWNRYREALAHPFRLPSNGPGLAELAFVNGTIVVMLLWWGLIGGAICRLAAVDFAKDRRIGIAEAFRFASRKLGSFFWSPLLPFIFILIFLACNAFLGLVGRIPAAGPILLGLGYWLAAVSSFIVLLLAIGGSLGMMYMWPTIAMEGTDTFDAVSRSFAYLYSRPWKTAWCVLVAWVYGAVCMAFAVGFTYALLWIAQASVSFGLGGSQLSFLGSTELWSRSLEPGAGFPEKFAAILVRVVYFLTCGLLLGFWASFKISAMTAIYAVIRRDVDGVDMSEVFQPEAEEVEVEAATEPASEESDSTQET